MEQMRETGTNSPNISCDFQLVLRGRLVAAPTNGVCKQQFDTANKGKTQSFSSTGRREMTGLPSRSSRGVKPPA